MEPISFHGLPGWAQWLQFISGIVTGGIIVLVGALWTLLKWTRRPRFIIGVPPLFSEQIKKRIPSNKVGKRSIWNQFKHKNNCFAVAIHDKEYLTDSDERRLFMDNLKCRVLELDENRCVNLPVIVENCGQRTAEDYVLGISFLSPKVHILDVSTESLDINAFYCTDKDAIENFTLKKVMANDRIVEAYDKYMNIGEQYGDIIFFTGALEGGMYEMILIKIQCEIDVNKFIIGFSLGCSDGWLSNQSFFQGFKIE